MFLTRKHMSRRTVLRGLGVTVALPFLDAMVPVRNGLCRRRRQVPLPASTRLVCIEQVHGAAGCSEFGKAQHLWNPAATGKHFDLGIEQPQPARALPRLPDHRQQHRRAHGRGDARRPKSAAITSDRAP